ncbi:MAG: SDR family NAD(P)-dependent oxidoreductase [Gemmatimonadetes bacterium]|uniref:SDR family NAD(P)-dependent oxidoreductase n=1 Tax=Candidatus Kutchimonas denitrificans TaxID=3056748 RepID=A0AAE4Z719_9BACT|nr:SDR family NAD(P)-dependent oxidoreductase [Candidatus Kutchimonas denitrificans]NIT65629.1 SDR family NAD(P)-dependent oxidoreductase [Gemmatimonadota bacterium]NIU52599.1 SDR family NAD(P)-dependent oxidoreductase [Gemmatimonadota bacterium]NIW74100.1 SDR family NAD(P)-dependent oxidoreductase [Gemmatimonadota bacterium]NIY34207.1 SDR family NAD(P)-dependent oxidoreductase [Gemmatimonadota bacterium]
MLTVTVTGAAGTVGRACVKAAVQAGHEVRALVRNEEEFRRVATEPRVEVWEGDILDRAEAGEALTGTDAVVHCVDFAPREFGHNWDAIRHALEGLRPGGWFVYPGNLWVFGPPQAERVGPDHPKASPSRLGAVRADLEKAVTAQGGTVIHMPALYGPGVKRGWLYDAFRRALAGKPAYFPGDLDRPIEFLYVADAARALIAPLGRRQARGSDYTAPGYRVTTPREMIGLIYRAAAQEPRVRSIPVPLLRFFDLFDADRRLTRDLSYLMENAILLDGTAIRRELGWQSEVDYADGARRTVRWLRHTS